MVLESVPEHGYGCDDGNVYARGRHGILIANARVSCRSIVPASESEESSQNTVAPENGSANGDDHVHDCGHVLWQMLAEHRMKPFYAHPRVRSSLKLAQRPPAPRMYIVRAVYSQSLSSPSWELGCLVAEQLLEQDVGVGCRWFVV